MGRPIGITALVNFKSSSTRLVYCRSSRNRIIRNSFSRAGWWGGFPWASWGHQYKVIFCANRSSAHSSPSDQYNTVSSVTESCLTLCEPMNCSTPGLPVHHQLPEFTQTHVHRVGDAIQQPHPLSSPSPPAPNPSQHQNLFQWVNSSHEVTKVLEFQLQHHSFQRTPRADLLQNGLVGSPCSPRDSQESSPTPQFKSIHSALSFLHSPTLTSIHDYWKNHNLD